MEAKSIIRLNTLGMNFINEEKSYQLDRKFLGLCKTRFSKFKGIGKENFYLFLKECEFNTILETIIKRIFIKSY